MNRLRAGMTQAELARAIGTTQSHVSEYESGARRIETMPAGEFVRPIFRFIATGLRL